MNNIYGIVPPATTPFDDGGNVELSLLATDLRYMIETAGVHGLAVCGSTGEGHTLTTDETRRITGTAIDVAAGRVPIITGIIADSTRAAVERGKAVADLGVAALQVTPVHYLFRPDDDAMLRFFADIVDGTGLPVMIYNVVPWAYLSPELLTRIISQVDGVIGVKQSAGDMKLLADLLLQLDGLDIDKHAVVMSAVDALLYPSFTLGANGAIAAILTAAPELCVLLWDAVQVGQKETARDLHARLLRLWNVIQADNLPANVKVCQALQGRPAGVPRSPMPQPSAAERAAIERVLGEVLAG